MAAEANIRAGEVPPPQDIGAERALLGTALIDIEAASVLIQALIPDDFFAPAHQKVFAALQTLQRRGDPVDIVSVLPVVAKDGIDGSALVALVDEAGPGTSVPYLIKRVVATADMRRVMHASSEVVSAAHEWPDDPDDFTGWATERFIRAATETRRGTIRPSVTIGQAAQKAVEEKDAEKRLGVPTGIPKLDKYLRGWQPEDLIVVAGRPSMGKSAFCLTEIALAAARAGRGVMAVSLEMNETSLGQRAIAHETMVEMDRIQGGFLSAMDHERIERAQGSLDVLPLYLFCPPAAGMGAIRAEYLLHKAKGHPIDLIIIDHAGLVTPDDLRDSREQQVSKIAWACKVMARDFKIPVILLSQLSRKVDERPPTQRRPMLSDLRESGSLEQNADIVVFLYREEYYLKDKCPPDRKGVAEIIIDKHRNGPLATVDTRFYGEFSMFQEIATE
jgi:replicative DNA helicase